MSQTAHELRLQLLRWIAERPRTYGEVIEAWRTTCPRFPIWEDACADGLIERQSATTLVRLTAKGRWVLDEHVDAAVVR